MFSSADNTTAGLAIQHVRQAVNRWEPRAEIVSLDAVPQPGNEPCLVVELSYRVKTTAAVETFAVTLPLA